jgi:hypothetical protein
MTTPGLIAQEQETAYRHSEAVTSARQFLQ